MKLILILGLLIATAHCGTEPRRTARAKTARSEMSHQIGDVDSDSARQRDLKTLLKSGEEKSLKSLDAAFNAARQSNEKPTANGDSKSGAAKVISSEAEARRVSVLKELGRLHHNQAVDFLGKRQDSPRRDKRKGKGDKKPRQHVFIPEIVIHPPEEDREEAIAEDSGYYEDKKTRRTGA